jgi:hypothetical protein
MAGTPGCWVSSGVPTLDILAMRLGGGAGCGEQRRENKRSVHGTFHGHRCHKM